MTWLFVSSVSVVLEYTLVICKESQRVSRFRIHLWILQTRVTEMFLGQLDVF